MKFIGFFIVIFFVLFQTTFTYRSANNCESICRRKCARPKFYFYDDEDYNIDDSEKSRKDVRNNNENIFIIPRINSRTNVEDCEHRMCETYPDYPLEKIKEALKKNSAFLSYFGTIAEPVNGMEQPISFQNRINIDQETKNMCNVKTYTKHPRLMKNTFGENCTIVNDDKYKQAVKYEYCHEDKCFCEDCALPFDSSPHCKQQYVNVRLVTFDNTAPNELKYESFPIPGGCACVYLKKTSK